MKIHLGADHRGFALKEHLKSYLESSGYSVIDHGAFSLEPQDDYVDFAKAVAQRVREEKDSCGVVLCGSGVGVAVTANKVAGVRAVLGFNEEQVQAARSDDDVNVLALASDFTSESAAIQLVERFLGTTYRNEERFARRLTKLETLEKEERENAHE